MAVAKMKKIYVFAPKSDRRKLMEYLQRQSVVDISAFNCDESQVFSLTDSASLVDNLREDLRQVLTAREILNRYAPQKVSVFAALEGKARKSVSEFESFHQECEAVLNAVKSICDTESKITSLNDEIVRLSEKKEALLPWYNLTFPLSYDGTKNTSVFIGSLPQGYTPEQLENAVNALDENPGDFVLHIISSGKEQTCLAAAALNKDKDRLTAILNRLQFSAPAVSADGIPRNAIEKTDVQIMDKQNLIKEYKDYVSRMTGCLDDIKFLIDYLNILIEEYQAFGGLGESTYVFALEGWIPETEHERVAKELERRFACAVKIQDVTDSDDVPVLMRNNWFSEPVESVVTSYNRPRYKEIDPTAVTSFFYYLLFGLMFSDAAYGAMLVIGCSVMLLKYKNMERSINKFLRLFFWCGVSTVFWGIVFSSYFGDAVDVISTAFLGRRLTIPPLWFSPLENPMRLLLFCFALGIAHLLTGYITGAYCAAKNRDFKAAFFDSMLPIFFLLSLLAVFVGTPMFGGLAGFTIATGPDVQNVCYAIAGLSSLGILLMSGRESKNWVKRLLKGTFALYNVMAGWLSDILSYSRLLALGLATGVIGSVINTMGVMTGKSVFGVIVLIIVFIFGHLLNFGINILGSYVHSCRLAYVEFFGKFYEGGGRGFRPLGLNTKYYTIEEEF